MNLTRSLSVCLVLLVTHPVSAQHGFWTRIGRTLGYGSGDGYHAKRCCGPSGVGCAGGSYLAAVPQAPRPVWHLPRTQLERLPPVTAYTTPVPLPRPAHAVEHRVVRPRNNMARLPKPTALLQDPAPQATNDGAPDPTLSGNTRYSIRGRLPSTSGPELKSD